MDDQYEHIPQDFAPQDYVLRDYWLKGFVEQGPAPYPGVPITASSPAPFPV